MTPSHARTLRILLVAALTAIVSTTGPTAAAGSGGALAGAIAASDKLRAGSLVVTLADDEARASAVDARLSAAGFVGAVLVARGNVVVLRAGYGHANAEHLVPNTPDTKFDLGSVTKPLTAMAVLALQERGALSVTDSVCRYLDGCPENWRDITVHHLLTHTSGIPDVTRVPGFMFGDPVRTYLLPHTTREVLGLVRGRPLDFAPGERWQYSNSGYIALGEVIQTTSGAAWHELLRDVVLRPAGMHDTGYDVRAEVLRDRASGYEIEAGKLTNARYHDPSNTSAAGGLYSTVEDLYRWERARAGGELLAPASWETLFVPHWPTYGYGWFLSTDNGAPVIWHGGRYPGFSNCVVRYVQEEVFVALLSNVGQTPACELSRDVARLAAGS